MIDLSTAAGVLRFAELRRAEMVRFFECRGRFESPSGFSFCAFVFATHAVDGLVTGSKLPHVEARVCDLPAALADVLPRWRLTELFGDFVRKYAQASRAIGSILMTEVWTASAPVEPDKTPQEQRDGLPRDLKDAPGRREALQMWLTHRATGHRHWSADIHREPTRLGPWVAQNTTAIGGNLVNLTDGWQN